MSGARLPPLYAICDADVCAHAGWTLIDFASACLDGGARLLQIRAKTASSGWLLACTQAVVARAASFEGATIIVNDRADVARLAGAAGVHVGQDDLTPSAVRTILGDTAMVGLSTHTAAQLDAAIVEPISYLAIGPIFETSTKATGFTAVGLQRVEHVHAVAAPRRLPVVAIGGITLENAAAVLDAGASTVAVISDLLRTDDPRARVRDYLRQLRGYNRAGEP